MNTIIETKRLISIPEAPQLAGLIFRGFQGESDYPHMLACINGSKAADGEERADTLEDLRYNYAHLNNCDPYRDMLFAEVNDQVTAYSRCWWEEELNGDRIYNILWFIMPEWRQDGIGEAILAHQERRCRQIAVQHPPRVRKYFQVWSGDKQVYTNRLLEAAGYRVVRYGYSMTRPIADPLPEAPMPPGLEVRPVKPEHYRKIWDAMSEAFRDHWGYVPPTENDYQAWLGDRYFQPHLWKVGWAGDEVAGMVLNFINEEENREYNRKRGYTEGISVRRPWRRLGLARSLLVQSIEMFRQMGIEETALGVDAENPNGALNLYQGVGYRVIKTGYTYRKPME